jgi:hypothetical protein
MTSVQFYYSVWLLFTLYSLFFFSGVINSLKDSSNHINHAIWRNETQILHKEIEYYLLVQLINYQLCNFPLSIELKFIY